MCMFYVRIYICIAASISMYVHSDNSSSGGGSSSTSSSKHSSSSHYNSSGSNLYYRCIYVYTYLKQRGRSTPAASSAVAACEQQWQQWYISTITCDNYTPAGPAGYYGVNCNSISSSSSKIYNDCCSSTLSVASTVWAAAVKYRSSSDSSISGGNAPYKYAFVCVCVCVCLCACVCVYVHVCMCACV